MDDNRYDGRMPYRRCGKSGLLLPEISLGLWHNFGGVDDFETGRAVACRAFDQGVTHFDLANNYGPPPGSAEENFGRLLREDFAAHRDEIVISTKAGHLMWDGPYGEWGSRKHVISSLDQSLRRMGIDYVDIFYSHRPDPDTPLEETMGALADVLKQGKALYLGLSKYPLDMLKRARKILREMGVDAIVYQGRYSLLYRGVEGDGILDWLKEKGMGFTGFSPLGQGMLTGKYLEKMVEGSRAEREEGFLTTDEVEKQNEVVRGLAKIAEKEGIPLTELALRWALRNKAVTSLVIGARTVAQLDENLAVVNQPKLDAVLRAEVDSLCPPLPTGEGGHG